MQYILLGSFVIICFTLATFLSFSKVVHHTLINEGKSTLKIYSMGIVTTMCLLGVLFGTTLLKG